MEKKHLQNLSELDKAYDFDFTSQSTAAIKRRDPKMIDSYFHGTAHAHGHGAHASPSHAPGSVHVSGHGSAHSHGSHNSSSNPPTKPVKDRRHTTA